MDGDKHLPTDVKLTLRFIAADEHQNFRAWRPINKLLLMFIYKESLQYHSKEDIKLHKVTAT